MNQADLVFYCLVALALGAGYIIARVLWAILYGIGTLITVLIMLIASWLEN